MIVVTPWQIQFCRYLAPVTPLTLIFLFVTLIAIRRWLCGRPSKWGYGIGVLVTGVPIAAMLLVQITAVTHLFRTMAPISYYDSAGRERELKLIAYGSEWHALDPLSNGFDAMHAVDCGDRHHCAAPGVPSHRTQSGPAAIRNRP